LRRRIKPPDGLSAGIGGGNAAFKALPPPDPVYGKSAC